MSIVVWTGVGDGVDGEVSSSCSCSVVDGKGAIVVISTVVVLCVIVEVVVGACVGEGAYEGEWKLN